MSTTTTTSRSPATTDALTTITAQAQKAYSTKDYLTAVSLYATACELQAQLHGSENDPRNAHLLYLYGKALYQVAVSKSDIFGGAAMKQEAGVDADADADADTNTDADGDRERRESKNKKKDKKKTVESRSKRDADLAVTMAKKGGLFSFQGDENWDNSDDDDEEEGGEGEDEEEGVEQAAGDDDGGGGGGGQESPSGEGEDGEAEEEDDMANAWEVLDLARVLFHKTLNPAWTLNTPLDASTTPSTIPPSSLLLSSSSTQALDQSSTTTTTTTTTLKTQLADVYDLLGEISLESEAFNQAVDDLRSSLQFKLSLFPSHNKLVSEAHFKLSLALEFASAMEGVPEQTATKLIHEAAEQMSLAIGSVKGRIALEEQEQEQSRAAGSSDKDKGKGKRKEPVEEDEDEDEDEEKKKKSLQDAREIVTELEQRLVDLRALLIPATESHNPLISDLLLKSVLGTMGESSSSSSSSGNRNPDPAEQKRRLDETVKQAKDVSNLVRKKPKAPPPVEVVERGADITTSTTVTVGMGVGGAGADSIGKAAGKRKLEDIEMLDVQGKIVPIETNGSGGGANGGGKKVKVEDSLDKEEKDGGSAAIP